MKGMDLQTIVTNALAAERAEQMKTSPQLTLGELILKLEAVGNKELPVVFDVGKYHPTDIDSWRGRYNELALNYVTKGEPLSVRDITAFLRGTVGSIHTGYKGGDYLMGKTTPVWVANYGDSEGPRGNEDYTAMVDVREGENRVILITAVLDG